MLVGRSRLWRALHDDEARLQVPGKMLSRDPRHGLGTLAKALSAINAQRVFNRKSEFVRRCRGQLFVRIGHPQTMSQWSEQSKNEIVAQSVRRGGSLVPHVALI